MFKKGFFYIALILITLGGVGCSSNSGTGEDLDISEIQEIEATGEFSEDEFFSDDSISDIAEEQLVEEVPGLEAELEGDVAQIEESLEIDVDDFDIDIAEDNSESGQIEGADLFDDVDLATNEDAEEGFDKQNVTVQADDLGFDDELDLEGEVSDVTGDIAFNDEELELDSEEDLFRDEDIDISTDIAANEEFEIDEQIEDVSLDVDFSQDVTIAEDTSASEVLEEDVSIDDVDYSDQIADNNQTASDLLAEDVSIDVDYSNEAEASTVVASAGKGLVSVKKMKTVPYSKNGVLVNAIYFVRSGDTLKAIADKIYGNGSAVDFRLVNSHLKKNSLKTGQKVYYNSPTRSQDRSRLLTYYEDAREPVQMYSAQEGENIRAISKNLLGHSRSWMEVWATNQQIESKGNLEGPYQIRYWNGGSTPTPILASNENVVPTPADPVVASDAPEVVSQASLDLGDEPINPVEEVVLEEAQQVAGIDDAIIEESFGEPDMELDEPAEVVVQEDDFAIDEADLIAEAEAVDEIAATATTAAVETRDIARNQGAFPAKNAELSSNGMRMGIIGIALLLLLAVGFLVVKRRRESEKAIEMESFDFGGETTIEEAQTKTQIDI